MSQVAVQFPREVRDIDERQVSAYVRSALALADAKFPNAFFGARSGTKAARIELKEIAARYIHLNLPDVEAPLHLHHLEIDADGWDASFPTPIVKASSVERKAGVAPDPSYILTDHMFADGLHTAREKSPWVLIDLGAVYKIRSIAVHNHVGRNFADAWNLRLSVARVLGDWTVVWRHTQEIANLKAALAAKHAAYDEAWSALLETADEALIRGLSRAYAAPPSFARLGEIDPRAVRILRDVCNREIFFPRSLEWSVRGAGRTFRFWSLSEKQTALRRAVEAIEALNAHGFRACIGYGLALAAGRDGDFIPHDDDVDIIVAANKQEYPTGDAALKATARIIEKLGYNVPGLYEIHFHGFKDSTCLDVFVGYVEDGFVNWRPGPGRTLRVQDIFPARVLPFLDVPVPLPRNLHVYLDAVYGEDWREPKPGWTHRMDSDVHGGWFVEHRKQA